MIDDTGLDEFHGSSRSWRLVFTLAAISLAAACDEAPSDDAVAAELSIGEVLALCDELRDAVQRNDAPAQCGSGDRYWILPSNEDCRNTDLSACDVTVGQLRRCHERARQDPCAVSNELASPADLSPIQSEMVFAECMSLDGCYPLVPTTGDAFAPACTAVGIESLQTIDGVYEVTPDLRSDPAQCPGILPEVLELNAPRFVLVSTEASGAPEVVLQSCNELPDCQALAREIQAAASPRSATPYNHLRGCETPLSAEPFRLVHVPADASPCEAPWLPQVAIEGNPSSLLVIVSDPSRPPQMSPGCGYIIPPSAREPEACVAFAEYSAVRVSAL